MSMVLAAVKNGIVIVGITVLENRDPIFSFIDGSRIINQIEEYPNGDWNRKLVQRQHDTL